MKKNERKRISILLLSLTLFSLTGCSSSSKSKNNNSTIQQSENKETPITNKDTADKDNVPVKISDLKLVDIKTENGLISAKVKNNSSYTVSGINITYNIDAFTVDTLEYYVQIAPGQTSTMAPVKAPNSGKYSDLKLKSITYNVLKGKENYNVSYDSDVNKYTVTANSTDEDNE